MAKPQRPGRARVFHTLPVIVGFALGCAVGAAAESVYGLWSLRMPTGLALFLASAKCADD
jgi:uncharacterized membrane protein YoaK (UPF0700 family)